ncbi:MAG: hypothetical protein ACK56I_01640, partial [bacterium]
TLGPRGHGPGGWGLHSPRGLRPHATLVGHGPGQRGASRQTHGGGGSGGGRRRGRRGAGRGWPRCAPVYNRSWCGCRRHDP